MHDFNEAISQAKSFSLTQEEKENIWNKINQRFNEKPAPQSSREIFGFFPRGFETYSLFVFYSRYAAPVFAVLLLMVVGGTSVAAQGALPGDPLYRIKTEVNEKIKGVLAFTPKAKAYVEASFAGRRLEEAERLAVEGRLNERQDSEAVKRFEKHTKELKNHLIKLKTDGEVVAAADIETSFEASLNVHRNLLSELSEPPTRISETARASSLSSGTTGSKSGLLDRVKSAVDVAAFDTLQIGDNKTDFDTDEKIAIEYKSIQGVKNTALNKLEEVDKYLKRKDLLLGFEDKKKAEGQINEAKIIFALAEQHFSAGDYTEAFSLFRETLRLSHEVKIFIRLKTNLIHVSATSTAVSVFSATDSNFSGTVEGI